MKKIEIPSTTKALLFDLDGTIADNMQAHYRSWVRVFEREQYDFSYDEFLQMAGMSAKRIIEKLRSESKISISDEEGAHLKEEYYLEESSEIFPVKAVMELIERYEGILPMAIGTGSRKELAFSIIRKLGIENKFKAIVTANDVTFHKPHPETFLRCAELLGVSPKNCLVLEDGPMGIEAAIRAEMKVIDVKKYY